MDTMKHRTLSVQGMTCTGCEGKVEGTLKEMQGRGSRRTIRAA